MRTRISVVMLALFVLAGGALAQDWGGASTQNAYNNLSFASDLVGAGVTVSGTAYKIVGGPSQTILGAGSGARCTWMNPGDLNTIFVGLSYPARIAKSTNGGTSWTTVPVVFAGGGRPNSAVYQIFATGGTMLACGDTNLNALSGVHGFVTRSTDGGMTWSTAVTGFEKLNMVIGKSSALWLAFGEAGGNYQSADGGVSFATVGNAPVLRFTRAALYGDFVYVTGRTLASAMRPAGLYESLQGVMDNFGQPYITDGANTVKDLLVKEYGLELARDMVAGKVEAPNGILALSKAFVYKFDETGFLDFVFTDEEAYTSSGFDITMSNFGGPVFELATQRMLLQGGNSLPYIMKSFGGETWSPSYTGATNGQQVLAIERSSVNQAFAGGPFGLIWTTSALPVELARFIGVVVNSSSVRLDWTTISERNNYGFYVERAVASGTFVELANSFVPGHGTTLEPHNYTWTDNSASTGRWQYRLRQQDLDGVIHYSELVNVDVLTGVVESIPIEFALKQNYPNPFNPATTLTYSVASQTHVLLTITNALGQKVATLVNEQQPAGEHVMQFNASNLPSGTYFYRINAGDFVATKKMLLMK